MLFRSRARCVTHPTMVSGWSSSLPVTITQAGYLTVSPIGNFVSSGSRRGPFVPESKSYDLQNTGNVAIEWIATNTQIWVTLSNTGGTLAPGASTTVTVYINSNANNFKQGTYSGVISFSNITNNNGSTVIRVMLRVLLK